MKPLGYMYKRVARRTGWLSASQVTDIYSLSGCVSEDFADYIGYWKHNGFWLFDSPSIMRGLAADNAICLEGLKLFYYEAYDLEYDDGKRAWREFAPEPSFGTNVCAPRARTLEGFDVTSFSAGTSPECSPLSCNACAERVATNEHCLFRTLDEARRAIENGELGACEPGPYRIIAVYTVTDA